MAPRNHGALGASDSVEVRRLKAEVRRLTEERGIPKEAAAYFAKGKGEVGIMESTSRLLAMLLAKDGATPAPLGDWNGGGGGNASGQP